MKSLENLKISIVKTLIASAFIILTLVPGSIFYNLISEYHKNQELAKQTKQVEMAILQSNNNSSN